MTITPTTSAKLTTQALELGASSGLRLSVAIVDAGGHLLAFARDPDTNLATIDISVQKARTAVFFRANTRYLVEAMQPGGSIYGAQHTGGGLLPIPGGVPILDAHGIVIGALGISGGTVEQDDTIAVATLESITSR